jgi:DNA-binding MarR family transcriptional regulator
MTTEPRWLSPEQQRVWRSYLALRMLLSDQLGRELAERAGLTASDYQVLVELSEAPGRQMRMSDLAERTLLSKSRLSHQITRMEAAGLVSRADCPTDRRGAFAVLTERGWETIVAAAPGHVEGVRSHLFDLLSAEETRTLGQIADKVVDHLKQVRQPSRTPAGEVSASDAAPRQASG